MIQAYFEPPPNLFDLHEKIIRQRVVHAAALAKSAAQIVCAIEPSRKRQRMQDMIVTAITPPSRRPANWKELAP